MTNNPLIAAMGQQNSGLAQILAQFKSNPLQMLARRRMNIPQNIANDPEAIINHLLQTGQISQSQLNSAYQTAQRFRK